MSKPNPRPTGRHAKSDANREAVTKLRGHIIFITISLVISVGSTFVTQEMFIHVMAFMAAGPTAIGQEIFDFIKGF